MIFLFFDSDRVDFNISKFPAGEIGVSLVSETDTKLLSSQTVTVFCSFQHTEEVFVIYSLVDYIRSLSRDVYIVLDIPYFPAARADRDQFFDTISGKVQRYSFGLKVYSEIIGNLPVDEIRVLDPHSSVLEALLATKHKKIVVTRMYEIIFNLIEYIQESYFTDEFLKDSTLLLIAPDNGASKKVLECVAVLKMHGIECEHTYATKVRSPDGKIIEHRLNNPNIESDKILCLVLDDICDGGATFIGLANLLDETFVGKEIRKVLYTSHGLYTKGTNHLMEKYHNLICSNSPNNYEVLFHFTETLEKLHSYRTKFFTS